MSAGTFDLQGHRGARGLRPENTLPSFEAALDAEVTSIETDVHLTADGVPVLYHDHTLNERLCRRLPGGTGPAPALRPPLRSLSLAQLRGYRADLNPDPERFRGQDPGVTPAAAAFAAARGLDPYTPPTLEELFAFTAAYAEDPGKTPGQRAQARRVRFDLELKRVPFRPQLLGGGEVLERQVVATVRRAGVLTRASVRSFDHRCVRRVKALEPVLRTAVLVAGTAPVDPVALVRAAGADRYCPEVDFLDRVQVEQLHAAGIEAVPWTVNAAGDWDCLLDWGVDGITTDYPDRLAELLRGRGMAC